MNVTLLDAHIHIVGNGRGGSGCWLRIKGWWHQPLAAYMLQHSGMRGTSLDAPDFDTLRRYWEDAKSVRRLIVRDWLLSELNAPRKTHLSG